MIVLGISNNDYAGACIIKNDEISSAVMEERFTRIKAHSCFPYHSIEYVLSHDNISLQDVDYIAYGWKAGFSEEKHLELYFDRIAEAAINAPHSLSYLRKRLKNEIQNDIKKRTEFEEYIRSNNLLSKVIYVDHHESHADAAFYCSPFNHAITISCDGRGDFQSLTVTAFNSTSKNVLQRETTFDSLGYFYGRITKLLGFKPNRHEGKITGLAAHGDPVSLLPLMERMINIDDNGKIRANFGNGYLPSYNDDYELLEKQFAGQKPEDIAAAAQCHLENILVKLTKFYINESTPNNLCLAGGVFGNVKLNQRLSQIDGVENVYVLPCMGDGGIALGAAVCVAQKMGNIRVKSPSMKIGPNIESSEDIMKYLESDSRNSGLKYINMSSYKVRKKILLALKYNKIIGVVKGRMEFGPRSLCSRSIVCRANDVSINTTLNKKLDRTEFMPFAPITADVFASDCYIGWNDKQISSHFMTMTYNCTPYFSKYCPAVTHIDQTARPQIITNDSDPFMFDLLLCWESISKEPALINTSFNMHEEPIVNNMYDAIDDLKKDVVDVVLFNHDLLVWRADHGEMEQIMCNS